MEKEQGKNYTNYLKIYTATLEGKKWKNITPFEYNGADYSVAHPWISENGKQLFFASDMPGGFGGMDIYVSELNDGNWSEPVNLGEEVNTKGNEVFPFIHADETLYFASDDHETLGGLDIFYATENGGNWDIPTNLEEPFNSEEDDFGFIVDLDNIIKSAVAP